MNTGDIDRLLKKVEQTDPADLDAKWAVIDGLIDTYTEKELAILCAVLAARVVANGNNKGWFSRAIAGTEFERALKES